MSITLISPAFGDDAIIPRQFACDGDNVPPPLQWSPGPDGTRSFSLTMEIQTRQEERSPTGAVRHFRTSDTWPSEANGKTIRNSFGRSGVRRALSSAGR